MSERKPYILVSALCLTLLAASCASQGGRPGILAAGMPVSGEGRRIIRHDVRPGPGVSARRWLSEYAPSLKDGPGDTHVYFLDSGKPGATLLVVAGTHANEIAGMMAATLIVERARPVEGRLIVLPYVNVSGSSYSDADNPQPPWVRLDAASGTRYFKYGSRFIHPEDQGRPDPEHYTLPNSSETLPGEEQRNLNRAYPGMVDGTLAQRLAAAVIELLRREKVGIAVDMHEARPSSKVAWMIVANPKNLDTAVNAIFDLDDIGIAMVLDKSSEEFRGLSHREWGDHTDAQAFLVETVNPAQGWMGGVAVDQLRHPEFPLWKRVAVQLEALSALARNFNSTSSTGIVLYEGLPGHDELESKGLEPFF